MGEKGRREIPRVAISRFKQAIDPRAARQGFAPGHKNEGYMANRVVIGSQWGDEGKAKVVDFLTLDADIIVRFQGGANAGHTVEVL